MELQGAQTVPPAEGPQAAVLAFLQGTRHIGNRDAHADDLVVGGVPVLDDAEHLHVEHGEIHPQILVNLALRHLRIAVQMAKRLVDHVEHLAAVLLLAEHLTALGVDGVQVIAFLHELGHLLVFLRHVAVRHYQLILHVVIVFRPASQLLHVLRIVRIVVDGGHRAQLVEAFNEHTFRVHIGKAQRTHHLGHALLAPPLLDGLEQGSAHLEVVDKVNPSEAHTLALPPLISPMVDNSGNAPHYLPIAVGQKIVGLAEFKGGILVLAQRV